MSSRLVQICFWMVSTQFLIKWCFEVFISICFRTSNHGIYDSESDSESSGSEYGGGRSAAPKRQVARLFFHKRLVTMLHFQFNLHGKLQIVITTNLLLLQVSRHKIGQSGSCSVHVMANPLIAIICIKMFMWIVTRKQRH